MNRHPTYPALPSNIASRQISPAPWRTQPRRQTGVASQQANLQIPGQDLLNIAIDTPRKYSIAIVGPI